MHAHHADSAITVQGVSGHIEFTVADRAPNDDRFDQAREAVVSTRAWLLRGRRGSQPQRTVVPAPLLRSARG